MASRIFVTPDPVYETHYIVRQLSFITESYFLDECSYTISNSELFLTGESRLIMLVMKRHQKFEVLFVCVILLVPKSLQSHNYFVVGSSTREFRFLRTAIFTLFTVLLGGRNDSTENSHELELIKVPTIMCLDRL